VSALKRYNKLANNNDVYALNVIRIPVLRHGLVGELIEEEHIERLSSLAATITKAAGTGG